MSRGARNWPFLMLTTRPVRAAATSRSVCRERNAGICRTSTASATRSACQGSWMSVSTGTPSVSRMRFRMRTPSSRPGPRNDVIDVRFALSNDALKMYGIPASRAMAAIDRPSSSACSSLSMTHGPATSTRGGRPKTTSSVTTTSRTSGSVNMSAPRDLAGTDRGALTIGELALVGGFDEPGEQRMRPQRLRLELRVELHGQEERMVGQFDDFDKLAVKRPPGDTQPRLGQHLLVGVVELVAMPMALVDDLFAVELEGE